MDKPAKALLFSYLVKPHFRLKSPDRLLSEAEFDLARITVEDFRFVTREMTTSVAELPAEIRGRSTILRRLLSERDLFNAGRLLIPSSGLRVLARMLDFDPIHPAVLLTCGNYRWAGDRLPNIAAVFSLKGQPPLTGTPWRFRDDADVSLSEYLKGLAIAVHGTPVRRREVIKYVADKKAAHVSDHRKHLSEKAIDRAWPHMSITIENQGKEKFNLTWYILSFLPLFRR
ncbi:hypothetical protein [Mesorhizobium sp. L2C067A000]|uniref:hypothetical protein n=1 Tax=Mesorhizobium sp. L2C067A000 TaxID=1287106 RepID=UPI0003D017DC|nr:hypothetical protein [Mesorhizobium sp. L2C067A000]ESZ25403.1 hypothetical protein X733_31130 [Mesorhizobium sp. L2C067A000]